MLHRYGRVCERFNHLALGFVGRARAGEFDLALEFRQGFAPFHFPDEHSRQQTMQFRGLWRPQGRLTIRLFGVRQPAFLFRLAGVAQEAIGSE